MIVRLQPTHILMESPRLVEGKSESVVHWVSVWGQIGFTSRVLQVRIDVSRHAPETSSLTIT